MNRDRLKTILRELFWGFGKPKTRFQNRLRIANRTCFAVFLVYVGCLVHPQILFAHSLSHENYTFHSDQPLGEETRAILHRADRLLQQSDLFNRDDHHHLFLCNSPGWFRAFHIRSGRWLYAISHPTGNIFIANGDPAADLGWKTAGTNIVRSLSGLIAHEVTHNLVRNHLGLFDQVRLPGWKNEGYAEFISIHGQTEYELALVKDLPKSVRPNSIHPVYQGHLKRVLLAMDEKQPSFDDLLKAD